MSTSTTTLRGLALGLGLLALVATPAAAPFHGGHDDDDDDGKGKEELELDEAEVFIEWNTTDGDFGIQFFWDGEGWKSMRLENSDGKTVLALKTKKNVKQQGLTEGFFESVEPSPDELSMEEFFDRFPEGTWEFEGRTLDGDEIEGETEFTHVLPAAPDGLFPDDVAVPHDRPLLVGCDPVTTDYLGNPLEVELYEIVLETEGEILQVLSMILPGDADPELTVPPQFLEPDTEYKLEIIVQEESGNRTIAEVEFETL